MTPEELRKLASHECSADNYHAGMTVCDKCDALADYFYTPARARSYAALWAALERLRNTITHNHPPCVVHKECDEAEAAANEALATEEKE